MGISPDITNIPTGEQTQITPNINMVANTINGEGVVLAMKIADYIKSMGLLSDTNTKGPDFTRTAGQILEDNKLNGCNEAGVVIAALLRAKGVPTTYIQALSKEAVSKYSPKHQSLNGHVFLEADLGNKVIIINSTTGEITDDLPQEFIVGGRGLDAWDIGLRNGFDNLIKMFKQKHEELLTQSNIADTTR